MSERELFCRKCGKVIGKRFVEGEAVYHFDCPFCEASNSFQPVGSAKTGPGAPPLDWKPAEKAMTEERVRAIVREELRKAGVGEG